MAQKSFRVRAHPSLDVVVVGGGTTGIAAALAAARSGAHTALVEVQGFLGGNAVNIPAWLGFHDLAGQQVVGGIAQELVEKLRAVGGATPTYLDPITSSVTGVDGNWLKLVAAQELQSAGVQVWLHSLAVDLALDWVGTLPRVSGAYLMGRDGLHLLPAEVVVDCTDAGDLARMAGVRMTRGRAEDGAVQVSSWTVTVGDVDFGPLLDYYEAYPTEIRPFPLADPTALLRQMRHAEVFVMGSFHRLVRQAQGDGLALPRSFVPGIAFPKVGQIMHVASRVEDVDPTSVASHTAAELEGMRQTQLWMRFFREYVPGCANCRLVTTPSQIGIRETYHMEGRYTLTADDLLAGRRFEDVVARGGYHLDVHSPDHGGVETKRPPAYDIPFRCLVPERVDGLLVAGRAISATHEALASTRVIPISMAQGQAAGTAAALAAREQVVPRDVSVSALQTMLREDGAIL